MSLPRANIANPEKVLIGNWKAISLGEILKSNLRSLPSRIVFNKVGKFQYAVIIGRQKFEASGKYKFNSSNVPWRITCHQSYPREAIYEGRLEFVNKKTLKIIFYRVDFLPYPLKFIKKHTQIFIRE